MRVGLVLQFLAAAVAEIVGCYLVFAVLRLGKSWLLLMPSALCLAAFAWLLSIQTGPAGRTYAAYGGVYVAVAMLWMWKVAGIRPDNWDLVGVCFTLLGMGIIAFAPRSVL